MANFKCKCDHFFDSVDILEEHKEYCLILCALKMAQKYKTTVRVWKECKERWVLCTQDGNLIETYNPEYHKEHYQ
tara:strand:- start:848 stop:1072 length:225 start_codon:yes stop_codon:yes gene_type:complete